MYPILCVPGTYSADSLNWIEKEAVGKIRVVHHADGYSCRRASRKLLYAGNTSFISRSISIATILGSGINCPELFPRLFACSILVVLGEFLRRWWEKRKYQETTMILSSGISSVAPHSSLYSSALVTFAAKPNVVYYVIFYLVRSRIIYCAINVPFPVLKLT